MDLTSHLLCVPEVVRLSEELARGLRCVATGVSGSSTGFVASAVAIRTGRPVLLVTAHLDDAEEIAEELKEDPGAPQVVRVPALEVDTGERSVAPDLIAERIDAIRSLIDLEPEQPKVIVTPIHALMQEAPDLRTMQNLVRTVRVGESIDPAELLDWLGESGFVRREVIEEPGEFSVRGGVIDIFPPGGVLPPIRIDLFGDEIEKLNEIDPETLGTDRAITSAQIVTNAEFSPGDAAGRCIVDLVPESTIGILAETLEIVEQARGYFERVTNAGGILGPPAVLSRMETHLVALGEINQFSAGASASDVRIDLPFESLPSISEETGKAIGDLAILAESARVIITCQNEGEQGRLTELLAEHGVEPASIESCVRYLHRGFVLSAPERLAVLPYHELLHRFETRHRTTGLRQSKATDSFLDFEKGDYVVHADHGIARFVELVLLRPRKLPGIPDRPRNEREEYLTLEFAGGARLHVSCLQIDKVQRYIGGFSGKPPLSTMGGRKWKTQKDRVTESVRDLAAELLRVRAAREHMSGIRYPEDTSWQREFEAEFAYEETEDQLAALAEIKRDMQSTRPMDRLVCGDVGFGKTELAIRAAFKACEFGKQVAVLVPTTVLAEQHELTFRSRFRDYPFRVESLSRFKTGKEINDTLRDLRKGQIDVIIGTHRLLSRDVRFADLGLVVVDEEQRFGVEDKERLLQLRLMVDVLTLSATPIPRTLHMAMLGLRDISSLTTPPLDRRAIVTEVIPYNEHRVARAIARELAREGQVYFVHNRVYDIQSVADEVQKLAPKAKIVVGHGQMPPKELESVMLEFMRRKADVLVSTTIIESGIDNPYANTMIITNADRFGLADLHQLRGRVGRYKHRAYCYLLLPSDRPVREIAQKRLKAIEQYSMLGAGFKIAMRDLEIRGAGNLLGAEQSGHIAAVGYEMYCQLLDQAVQELTEGGPKARTSATSIEIGITGIIPKPYIPSDSRRLAAYRRIASATTLEELDSCRKDLVQAYGIPPKPVEKLFELAEIRICAAGLGVHTMTRRGSDIVCLAIEPEPVASALARGTGTVRVIGPELAQTNAHGKGGQRLSEVYLRLPQQYHEESSLLATLRTRLTPNTVESSFPGRV